MSKQMDERKLPVYAVRLRKLREERGLTQRQVADRCSFSHAMINRYENGLVEPKASSLITLAGFYHSSTDYILGIIHET